MYRVYMTDAMKALGGVNMRYLDLIKPPKIENRSKDEIIDHIRHKLEEV